MVYGISNERHRARQITSFFAVLIGTAILLIYPIHEPTTGGPNNIPRPAKSIFVVPSIYLGPLLITIGVFTFRHQTIKCLTPRRALLAPILCTIALLSGLGRYIYAWEKATPFVIENPTRTVDPSFIEIIDLEVGVGHVTSVFGMLLFFVGSVTARDGRKAGTIMLILCSLLLSSVLIPLILVNERSFSMDMIDISVMLITISVPLSLGYYTTKTQE